MSAVPREPDALAARKVAARKARAAIPNPQAAAAHALRAITPKTRKLRAAERRKSMGPIDRTKSYPKDKFVKLTGMGSSAWHKAVNPDDKSRPRLSVVSVSGKVWVTGEAYYEYLRVLGEWQDQQIEEERQIREIEESRQPEQIEQIEQPEECQPEGESQRPGDIPNDSES